MRQTDFLYFTSASYFWRFGDSDEFRKYVDLDIEKLKAGEYKCVHRNLVSQLQQRVPLDSSVKLYPFSLQKGANINGVIFGASHPLAVDKFLDVGWRLNNINGEANFDIDDDAAKAQGHLFESNLTKKESFQKVLREKVLAGEIANNKQAYDFALGEGHPARHANETLQQMKRGGEVEFESRSPLINYVQVYRKKRLESFKVE